MAALQWLRCNGSRFSRAPMFTNKATVFLHDGLYRNIKARHQGLLSQ